MKMYQFKTFVVLFMFSVSVFGQSKVQVQQPLRSVVRIYSNLKSYNKELFEKWDQDSSSKTLVLKDFHLLIDSGTWCAPCRSEQTRWEALAGRNSKKLNIIAVYDNGKFAQDKNVIAQLNTSHNTFHFFDENRSFYYFFKTNEWSQYKDGIYPLGVLIGPNNEILFEGPLVKMGNVGTDPLITIENQIKNYKRNSI